MHSSSTSTLVSSRSTTVGSRLEGKRISKMVTVTVVDVMLMFSRQEVSDAG